MNFRYIGSKARLVDQLVEYIGKPNSTSRRFVDAFCGTGVVASAAADLGWSVWVNDHLFSSTVVASTRLISTSEVSFSAFGGYEKSVATLNDCSPKEGFVWREYSPASTKIVGFERRYFTEANAKKIDAIREQIQEWLFQGIITETESRLLIGDLLLSASRVANIAGTFGCYLSAWTKTALDAIDLRPRTLRTYPVESKVTSLNVEDLEVKSGDLVYLDPPYTKRQYASYYHLLETVTLGDEPAVEGVSGLRPWKDKASDFCYKRRALDALLKLISRLAANRILLSYSCEGHIDIVDLQSDLGSIATTQLIPLDKIGRYRPNEVASSNKSTVTEYLLIIDKFQTEKAMAVNT